MDATEFYSQIPAESLTKIILATAPFIQDMNLRGCVQVEHYKRSEAIVKACRNLKIANFEGCRNLRKPTLNLLVQNNPKLVQLNLTGLIGVGNSTCKAIADNCPRLESLDVSWCSKVDSKGLRPVLEKCTRLTHLRASEVRGFDDIALATVMFETNNLKHLELSGCAELTDETLCIMMQGIDPEFDILTEIPIVPHRKLEYLDLSRCSRLTDAGVKTIAHATPRLEVLNLNRCKAVTDEAMIPIITSCPRITHLDLEELEHITNDLLSKHLASAPFAPKLQHMSLSYCENIGDTGVLPIIRTCTGLERICLDNTRISDLVLIEAGSMVAGRSTHSVTYGTPPEFTLDLAVYDCHHVTWTGIREILYRNTDRKGKEGSYTYPSQAIALKCFFGYQMTVDEHQRRVRKGNNKGAWRLEKKWAEYMQFTEEADITGARALERAGESGKGMVEFFENFRSQEVFSDARRYPYFRSHPLSSQRIESMRRFVQEQPHYSHRDSPERMAQHALILAKIHAFMDPPNQTLRSYPSTDTSLPGRYARAIAWYRDGQTDRALTAVDELIAGDETNPYFQELKGQVLFEEGRPVEAVVAHREAVRLAPDAPLLRVNLAHALIETNDPANLDEAISQLKHATVAEKDNTMAWRLLSQAYASKGMEGEARLASAELYFAAGAEKEAVQFALRARSMLQPTSIEWRRAMDIVLASGATPADIQDLDRRDALRRPATLN